jgi:hypothetical protein
MDEQLICNIGANEQPKMTVDEDGNKSWHLHGKRHRDDGPAVEYANGNKAWYLHGKRHRDDGPAVEWSDGVKEWWLHGKEYKDATTWAQATLKHQNKLHDDMSIEVFLRKVLVKNSADLL